VIDGVASAVKLAEALATLGLKTSKIGAYALPRSKPYLGALAPFGALDLR
jgi:allantoin racemase